MRNIPAISPRQKTSPPTANEGTSKTPSAIAVSATIEEAIKRIAKLYGVEKEVRGCSPQVSVAMCQKKAKPVFDDLETWLHAQLPKFQANRHWPKPSATR